MYIYIYMYIYIILYICIYIHIRASPEVRHRPCAGTRVQKCKNTEHGKVLPCRIRVPRSPLAAQFRTKWEQPETLKQPLPGSQSQNVTLTVSYVPHSLDIGTGRRRYRGTSLIRDTPHVGHYSSHVPRDLW